MSDRPRKRRRKKSDNAELSNFRQRVSGRALVIGAAAVCLLLSGVGIVIWTGDSEETGDITADQLDRDFQGIGLGALGVPESARLPQPGDSDQEIDAPSEIELVAATEPATSHADFATMEIPGESESQVVYPETTASAGPLFPNPFGAPSGRNIQPTQYAAPIGPESSSRGATTPASGSGPAWLTGGIEFTDE